VSFYERFPECTHVAQRFRVRNGVTQDDDRWPQEGVVFWRCGVVELEAIWPVVHAYVEGKGLIHISEDRQGVGGGVAMSSHGQATEDNSAWEEDVMS
jgi:hypothetical protein